MGDVSPGKPLTEEGGVIHGQDLRVNNFFYNKSSKLFTDNKGTGAGGWGRAGHAG